MRKLFPLLAISLISFFIISCAGITNWISQPLHSYSFNYDGKDFSILLPKDVLKPPETAIQSSHQFLPSPIIAIFIQYKSEYFYPRITIWFTDKLGIFMLVFHVNSVNSIPYMYVKGIPVLIDKDKAEKLIDEILYPEVPIKKNMGFITGIST